MALDSNSELLKDWPASLVARMVKSFCIDGKVLTTYADHRQALTSMAKHCTVTRLEVTSASLSEVRRVTNETANVLNCNVPVHIIDEIISEIVHHGKA